MNNILNKVRTKVSADRNRVFDEELNINLDASYITDRIIAMGVPAKGLSSVYRNHINDVVTFLKKHHGSNYMVWNLSEKKYKTEKFDNQVIHLEFPDHHPPPLDLLFKLILMIDKWLNADPKNVAVIHCVGGKGRTGTVCVCYLFFSGICATMEEAEDLFAKKRSSTEKGVTQPSQKRYIQYLKTVFLEDKFLNLQPIHLKQVVLTPMPTAKTIVLEVWDSVCNGTMLYRHVHEPLSENAKPPLMMFTVNLDVRGDVYFRVLTRNRDRESAQWHVVLHTYFIDTVQIELKKKDLDTMLKDKKFSQELTMGFTFGTPIGDEKFPLKDPLVEAMLQHFHKDSSIKSRRKALPVGAFAGTEGKPEQGVKVLHPLVRASGDWGVTKAGEIEELRISTPAIKKVTISEKHVGSYSPPLSRSVSTSALWHSASTPDLPSLSPPASPKLSPSSSLNNIQDAGEPKGISVEAFQRWVDSHPSRKLIVRLGSVQPDLSPSSSRAVSVNAAELINPNIDTVRISLMTTPRSSASSEPLSSPRGDDDTSFSCPSDYAHSQSLPDVHSALLRSTSSSKVSTSASTPDLPSKQVVAAPTRVNRQRSSGISRAQQPSTIHEIDLHTGNADNRLNALVKSVQTISEEDSESSDEQPPKASSLQFASSPQSPHTQFSMSLSDSPRTSPKSPTAPARQNTEVIQLLLQQNQIILQQLEAQRELQRLRLSVDPSKPIGQLSPTVPLPDGQSPRKLANPLSPPTSPPLSPSTSSSNLINGNADDRRPSWPRVRMPSVGRAARPANVPPLVTDPAAASAAVGTATHSPPTANGV